MRLGSPGGSSSALVYLTTILKIGKGTVGLLTSRVVRALLALRDEYMSWPDGAEQVELGLLAEKKDPLWSGVIGAVDGTLVKLQNSPALFKTDRGELLCVPKASYGLHLTCIGEKRRLIRYPVIGLLGCVNDSGVYNSTKIGRHPERFFFAHSYLLAYAAYSNSPYVVTPFNQYGGKLPKPKKRYNTRLSKARVMIENVYGIFKSRWASLTCLPGRLEKRI